MFDTIGGLPLHPLVVHATEVAVPLAAVVVLLAAVWPWFRRWSYWLPLLLALAALVLVPVSSESGESLERRVGGNSLIERHSQLAEGLLPWVAGLAVVAAAIVWWTWQERRQGSPATGAERSAATARAVPAAAAVVIVVAALATSVGTTVQAVMVGHSGATAVWQEDMGKAPVADSDE